MQNRLENKVYAGFFVRFVAFMIDSIIAALVVGIVKIPFSFAAAVGVGFLKANLIFEYTFLDVLGYVGVAAYFVLLTYFSHTTLGKMLFHLEVVTSKEDWTFVNILYRETVGRFLSSLLCVGYFAVLVQKDKQGFHDMLCDTYVVYKNMASVSTKPVRPVTPAPAGAVNMPMPAVQSAQPYQTPVYQQASAFQVTENHPVQAEPNIANPNDINSEAIRREEQQ